MADTDQDNLTFRSPKNKRIGAMLDGSDIRNVLPEKRENPGFVSRISGVNPKGQNKRKYSPCYWKTR
jgi:hypothetical protein